MEDDRVSKEKEEYSGVDTTSWSGEPPPAVLSGRGVGVGALAADGAPGVPMILERVEPSFGRGERVRLDAARSRFRFGRGEDNDVRLYTASASRQHAEISSTQTGDWVITPLAGKSITVDGDPTTQPVTLELGMNLELGEDHLRCVLEEPSVADELVGMSPDGVEPQRSDEGAIDLWRRARERPLRTALLLVLALLLFAWSFE